MIASSGKQFDWRLWAVARYLIKGGRVISHCTVAGNAGGRVLLVYNPQVEPEKAGF
jgi:hypothetical protein